MKYITDETEWVKLCFESPIVLAKCLQRLGRFGGQHVSSNVLMHTLEVRAHVAQESARTQLWALLHDAHEVLTGDVPNLCRTLRIIEQQDKFDSLIHRELKTTLEERYVVRQADILVGRDEFRLWDKYDYETANENAVAVFAKLFQNLLQDIECEQVA